MAPLSAGVLDDAAATVLAGQLRAAEAGLQVLEAEAARTALWTEALAGPAAGRAQQGAQTASKLGG
ncbi:MAG: hypothetical protein LBD90_03845 [Bifidobacteriaceae bacterium]|nr:hypothetical protein [Bifidobacteriaceae bacterium]